MALITLTGGAQVHLRERAKLW
ncbi:uncharacterized protein G2W53_031271 [Senna tora]|uniref:Uncharacterized protein n=1 Tax=Senna tora TaxID=362788 RepID=A0A834T8R1_9FABA|nr:uncharacterized protein G2W53_031271 [Senna tora]